MKHLSNKEFTELMKEKGKVTVYKDNKMMYTFNGLGEYKVCVEITIWLDENHIEERKNITFDKIMLITEAHSLYESI